MSDPINEIRAAQIRAGEEVVVAHLRKTGLVDKEPAPKNSKVICLQQQLAASQGRVKALEDLIAELRDVCAKKDRAARTEGIAYEAGWNAGLRETVSRAAALLEK